MEVKWNILYRGFLDSCNYDCPYCPFAKKKNTKEELLKDKIALENFTNWVSEREEKLSILITPWGEGLIRKYYQEAMIALSHIKNVDKIAIQTNLSCNLKWVEKVNKEKFALWITYHPNEVSFEKFVSKCKKLITMNIDFSIGVVGVKDHFKAIENLKDAIPERYIWVNAYKREKNYYTASEKKWLTKKDNLFPINNKIYNTLGKKCKAGYSSFSINGNGDVFRCHFIKNKIGNIYEDDLNDIKKEENCTNTECSCYIGYINFDELKLKEIYAKNLMVRIPEILK